MFETVTFHVDLENPIGFALAIWKSAKPANYFDGTECEIFKR